MALGNAAAKGSENNRRGLPVIDGGRPSVVGEILARDGDAKDSVYQIRENHRYRSVEFSKCEGGNVVHEWRSNNPESERYWR